ncbi:phosphotransferase family protein [Iamia sp. SCSIO 61187]|uniref:phosphotransferase family protein n=1 Tax=Iamia sp. SCSIO 61187 TaxID=2722752 RepID=UPI001C63657E|nr:phosphotransferase family protein [Iamia sp. SCSIO 61187]QYG92890.1 phosphotransferase family protein [Iamia sp. SCSIO 61187]
MALPSPRDPDELRAALSRWLTDRVGEDVEVIRAAGPPTTGFSNETILADATWGGAEQRLVVRVQPTTHTVFPDDLFEVQHRVMSAIGGGSVPGLPVPTLRWYEEDPSILGAPFMVMDRVDGEAPCDSPPYSMEGWLKDGGEDLQRAVWERGLDAMAAVHTVDWRTLGLADLDPCPDGGSRLGARVDAWADFLAWCSPHARQEVPELGIAWLRENQPPDLPDDEVALCWGDSRIGNQLFAGRESAETVRVAAVLDWEMVHVGDPVQDLGWFTWLDHTLSAGLDQPRLPGLPSSEETAARWEAATGRSAAHHRWAEINAGVGFAIVMVRLTALLKETDLFPQDSDFERTNMACAALERALAAMDVHPSDLH